MHGGILLFRCDRQTVLPEYHLTRERVFDLYQKETSFSLSSQYNKPFILAHLLASLHRVNIKGLARSGEYASLEDYIAKMDESMSGFELTLQTGNLCWYSM